MNFEPFYVKCKTMEEAQEVYEKSIKAGAKHYEDYDDWDVDVWNLIGVDADGETLTNDLIDGVNIIKIEDLDEYLGLEKSDKSTPDGNLDIYKLIQDAIYGVKKDANDEPLQEEEPMKVKPFFVKCNTVEEVEEVYLKSILAGAKSCDRPYMWHSFCGGFGVDRDNDTVVVADDYDISIEPTDEITMNYLDKHLGITTKEKSPLTKEEVDDGWIDCRGGKPDLDDDVEIYTKLAKGNLGACGDSNRVLYWHWHQGASDSIVAYKLANDKKESTVDDTQSSGTIHAEDFGYGLSTAYDFVSEVDKAESMPIELQELLIKACEDKLYVSTSMSGEDHCWMVQNEGSATIAKWSRDSGKFTSMELTNECIVELAEVLV